MKRRSYDANLKENVHVNYFSCFESVYIILINLTCSVRIDKYMTMIFRFLLWHVKYFLSYEKSPYVNSKKVYLFITFRILLRMFFKGRCLLTYDGY